MCEDFHILCLLAFFSLVGYQACTPLGLVKWPKLGQCIKQRGVMFTEKPSDFTETDEAIAISVKNIEGLPHKFFE